MQPSKLEDRPPFVTFETRSVEDRQASIDAGHYVGRDVDWVFITPAGSKDRIERVVSEWFDKLEQDLLAERISPTWVQSYKASYQAFREGKEPPVVGTSILNWPGLSPSQAKTLLSLNIRAVEDLAAANEETIARLGMGGRALKQRAVDWLASAASTGQVAEEISALRVERDELRIRSESLEAQVKALAGQVQAMMQGQALVNGPGQSPTAANLMASDLLDDPEPVALRKL